MVGVGTLDEGDALVLAALERVEAPLSGRAIARVTGLSQSKAQRTLARLSVLGLVVAEPAPPSLLYRLNHEHLAIPPLLTLLHLDDELRRRMAEEVATWRPRPVSVVVFGSVARGTGRAGSDVDLLVVRPDAVVPDEAAWQAQLTAFADRVRRWTGRVVSLIEMSRREATQGMIEGEPFLVEADRDGWPIAGHALRELARARR